MILKDISRGSYIFFQICYTLGQNIFWSPRNKGQVEIQWTVLVFKSCVCNAIFAGWDSGISSWGPVSSVPGRCWLSVIDRQFKALGVLQSFTNLLSASPKKRCLWTGLQGSDLSTQLDCERHSSRATSIEMTGSPGPLKWLRLPVKWL